MPPYLPPLLVSLLLALAAFLLKYPLTVGGLRVNALGLFLLLFALVNLRLAFRAAAPRRAQGHSGPEGAPTLAPWSFWVLALIVVGVVTLGVLRALHFTG